ncbi:hemicentin-1-like [Haliotis cracherodii]|uniref:hemicentin-1-like n=1 Tax=Haliotis cracherodii TaxID=6455 RepID=UPI0039EAC23D
MQWAVCLTFIAVSWSVGSCQGQLSISADAISGSEVYVSWDTLGDQELQDFRLSFTTSQSDPWLLLSVFPGIRGFRVMDLDPGELYYFRAQGQLGNEKVTAVTHVKTPPYASSRKPSNVTVIKVRGGVKVNWSAADNKDVLGYVVSYVQVDSDNVAVEPVARKSVFGKPEVVLDFENGARYKVQVRYRTRYGVGDFSLPTFIGEKLPVNPQMKAKPGTKKVVAGSMVMITCAAIADPVPTITWRRSGRTVNFDKKRFSVAESPGASTLRIHHVLPEDKGPYVCLVNNKVGRSIKARAVLKVVGKRKGYPQLTLQPESSEFEEGENMTFNCRGQGRGKMRYMWYRDGFPVTEMPRYVVDSSGYLTIYRLTKNDSGDYICEAANNMGSVYSMEANLQVIDRSIIEPASFKAAELVLRVPYGGAVNLTCEASGDPVPFVKWILVNEQTTTTERQGRYVLALTNVHTSGSYQCLASSGEDTITQNYEVIVDLPALPQPVIFTSQRLDGGAGFIRWRAAEEEQGSYPGVTGFTVNYSPVDASDRVIDAPKHSVSHDASDRKDLMPWLQGGYRYKVMVQAEGQAGSGPPSEPAFIPAVGQPEIVISPQPLTISNGSSAIFHCRASGKPIPLLYWTKGGNRINYDNFRFKMKVKDGYSMLRVDGAVPADSGTYTCIAANNILRLSVSQAASLEVLPREDLPEGFPEISGGPRQMNVSGQQFLQCVVEGYPDVNITWYKDSYPVLDSSRILQEQGRLYFNSLSRVDEGEYQCRGSNEQGDVFSPNLAVTKRAPASNRPSVKYVRLTPGSNVNLTCAGVGKPLPQVTWMYDGEEIDNGGSPVLQVMEIRESRNYTCVARTEWGESPATFVLTVEGKSRVAQGKPVIVTDTNRVEVRSGLGLNLTCGTGGVPVLYFKWLVGGEVIFQDNRGENINSSVLYLTNVRHDKNYTCVAVGARENAEVVFQVVVVGGETNPNKPIIVTNPTDVFAFAKQPATLDCHAEGDPAPIVTWYKDGKKVLTTREDPLSPKVILLGGKLFFLRVFHNEEVSDAGVYYCNATNVFGSTISKYATLQIAAVPRITTQPKPVKIRRGGSVNLTCTAVGPPQPLITWRLNNQDLQEVASQAGSNVLILRNVKRSANYTCVAHNTVGRTQAVFPVWVGGYEETRNKAKVKEIKVVPGSFVNLTCVTEDPQNTIYSWSTDGEDIPVFGAVLALPNVRKSVNYTCRAESPHKRSEATFMVVMEAEHALVIGGTEYVEELDTLSLTCNATGEYADVTDLEWFKDGSRLDAESDPEIHIVKIRLRDHDLLTSRLTIIRSRKRDTGVYACRTPNSGHLRSMDVFVFRDDVTPHVKKVRVVKGDYVNLTCVTPGSRTSMYVWQKNGAYIKGRTESFFSLNKIQKSSNYTCISQGSAGASKATFMVIVEGRAGVTISGPQSITVGTTVRLRCNATGRTSAPSDVVWLKDGEELHESDTVIKTKLSGPDDLTLYALLEVTNSQTTDSGTYVCQSTLGDSSTFQVKVKEVSKKKGQAGTRITVPPKDKSVEDGAVVRFYCGATGSSALSVHWETKGRRVISRGRFSVRGDRDESVLEIDPVVLGEDDGQVACIADDSGGPTQSHFATLTIYDHTTVPFDFPAITEHPALRAVERGRTTVFQCEALGTKNASILWYKDQFPISTGGRYTVLPGDQRSALDVSGVETTDEGVYQCSVENQAGIVYSQEASLYVRGRQFPPQFTRSTENKRVRIGDDVTMVCTAVGSPVPLVRWVQNGRPINRVGPANGRDVIRLKNVQQSTNIVCTAENLLGNIEYTARVIVEDPDAVPAAPGQPNVTNVGQDTATVSWANANKEGISPITVFIIHVRKCKKDWHENTAHDVIVSGGVQEVVVSGLKPGTCYQVRLTAKNSQGAGPEGEPSEKFYTRKKVSRAAPHNVKARLVMRDGGLISWTEPAVVDDTEALQEYRVLYTINPSAPIQYWNNMSVPRDQTSALIRGLSQFATYTFRIQATYNDGQRVESNDIELFIKDSSADEIQLRVSNLEGEILSPSSVKIYWKNPVSVEPTEGYELSIDDGNDYQEQIRITGAANSYVLSGLLPGGGYVVRIARRTKYGVGPQTEPMSIRLPSFVLEAPTITDLSPLNSTAIMVTWETPPSESPQLQLIQGYVVSVDNQRRRESRRVSVDRDDRQAVVEGLTADTRYSVRVSGITDQGDGPSSDPLFVSTNSRDSQAPIMEEVAGVNQTSLFIRWRPSPFAGNVDPKGYFVYIEKVKAGPWDSTVRYIMDVRPGTNHEIAMGQLSPGTKYSVEVAWYNSDGEGPKSEPMTGSTTGEVVTTPIPDFLPRAPYLEEVTAMNATSILVTWWPPDEEMPEGEIKGYYVYIERMAGSTWIPESRYQTNIPPEGQLFIISSLKPKSRYRVTVSAYSENGEGLKSDQLVVETPRIDENMGQVNPKRSGSVTLPSPPVMDEVSAINVTSVSVKWRPSRADTGPNAGNIHGYYLYVEVMNKGKWKSEFKFETNALPAGQQLTINGLERNRKYRIRVSGFGPAGEGSQSEAMTTETTENVVRGRTEEREQPPSTGFCQIYLGTICSRYLRNKSVFVTSRFEQSQKEDRVIAAVTYIGNRLNQRCANLALQTVCYTAFPPCTAIGNVPTPRAVCREDCYSMDSQCRDELALVRANPLVGDELVPQCNTLRTSSVSSGGTCVRVITGLAPGSGFGSRRGESRNVVPSSPQRLAVNPVSRSPYRVRLVWMSPHKPNGDITGYEVAWSTDAGDTYKKLLPANQLVFETKALYRGLRYEFEVRAMNQAGMSEPIRAALDIPEGVPMGAPQNVEGSANATSIQLTWDPPSRALLNGRLGEYVVTVYLADSPSSDQTFQVGNPGLVLQNVEPRTEYVFQIAARNRAGVGPWSPKVSVRTG